MILAWVESMHALLPSYFQKPPRAVWMALTDGFYASSMGLVSAMGSAPEIRSHFESPVGVTLEGSA
jgi:hypothetical protein